MQVVPRNGRRFAHHLPLQLQPHLNQFHPPPLSMNLSLQLKLKLEASATTPTQNSSSEDSSDDDSDDDTRTTAEILEDFSYEWLVELDRDDRRSLALFLCNVFTTKIGMQATAAAELTAEIVAKSDRSVRQWRTDVIKNKGRLPKTKQGCHERKGVLWQNEELSKMAKKYVQEQFLCKGTYYFCRWVNTFLLPNLTLEPGFPRKVSVSTCRRWLQAMGLKVYLLTNTNGQM